MSSKSRLGKGLGALFPELPGEESSERKPSVLQPQPSDQQPSGRKSEDDASRRAAVEPRVAAVSRETRKEKEAASVATAPAAKPAKPVKPAKTKKQHRAEMPALGDIVHPSDMFFHDTVSGTDAVIPPARPVDMPVSAPAGAPAEPAVSRETVAGKEADKDKDKGDEVPELKPVEGGYLAELKLDEIGPNAHQPRTIFDEDDLNELAASIKEVGVLQPIVVRRRPAVQIEQARRRQEGQEPANRFDGRMDSPYELIMGERRWRASQLAGLDVIPAIVKTTADDDMLRDALLENLHRVALNPLEEAAAYQQMIDEFGLTQAQLSRSVSKSRPQIANTLRLLNLPASVQKKVAAGILTAGHARALLGLNDQEAMDKLADRIIAEGLSVRSTEEIVALTNLDSKEPKKPKARKNDPWAGSPIQSNLENRFDTKVSIKGTPKHGRIEIVFSSPEDMDRILALLMPEGDKSADDQWV